VSRTLGHDHDSEPKALRPLFCAICHAAKAVCEGLCFRCFREQAQEAEEVTH
jgi:hypothetical protein